MKSKITILLIAFISTVSIAQSKVGTIDSDYIMSLMPEAKIVMARTQAYGIKLDSSFAIKTQNYQARIDEFKSKEKEMGELMKKTLINEIAALEQDIKKYQTNGNKLMQLKQNELMRPLYKILNDAINIVSKENGYTQVLTSTGNQFVYIDVKFDITALVMAKLGVKEPAVKK
tara:strand:+ start:157 stop:675 length:519 start_codon:yes stop_codon:yes gene_type:complete